MEYKYQSFFEKIITDQGKPEYAIGVTFGVDLDKWRNINKSIFGQDFSERTPFYQSFLFTDKVYIKDTNPNRDLYKGNLLYAIPRVRGYLHTKFVLLCYKEKYVLVLSTKNITGNSSYDCILPLVFTKNIGTEKLHGAKVKEYLEYLKSASENFTIPSQFDTYISLLDEYQITSTLDGFSVGLFEFAYSDKRFSDDVWKKVCESQKIVSPYLDESMIKNISKDTEILAYPEQIEKIREKNLNVFGDLAFRVGKSTYIKNLIVAQRKYHAKLYFYWNNRENEGRMIVGSANLTNMARNTHCEMLVELQTDNEEIYKSSVNFFTDPECTEKYDPNKDYTQLFEDADDVDDEMPVPVVGHDSSFYVKWDSNLNVFELHVVAMRKQAIQDEIWGSAYTTASFYVQNGGRMILVDENRYIPNEQIGNFQDALTYEEYSKLIYKNLQQLQKESDKFVLTGKKKGSFAYQGSKEKDSGSGTITEDIPCLFETVFRKLEEKRQKNKASNVTTKQIVEQLQDIRNSLYDQKLVSQINVILKSLEIEDE